jgi:pilus assembly protein Flp/PilA
MKKMQLLLKRLAKKQYGATMVEYALMLALIAIVSIVMITGVGQNTNKTFSTINSALNSAGG